MEGDHELHAIHLAEIIDEFQCFVGWPHLLG